MMFAFARDGGIPGHKFFQKVDAKRQSPVRTSRSQSCCALIRCAHETPCLSVWLACTLSFILGLPSLGSSVAFSAATSIATIGLYISYGVHYPFVVNHEYLCFYRPPHSASRHLPRRLCQRAVPSRQILVPCRTCRCDVDSFHHHRVYFTRVKRKPEICWRRPKI